MAANGSPGSEARRAEVLAALSISIDLGLGLPMEHVLRSSLLASLLADELELSDEERATVYYTNLVLWIGCHADSHEFSRWFGDDLAMRRDGYQLDWSGLPYMRFLLQRTGSHQSVARRTQLLLTLMLAPRTQMAALIHSHCLSAGLMAQRVGLDHAVAEAVECAFERWDGTGLPGGRRGDQIPLATRVVQLAETCEVHLRTRGTSGALAMTRERSGGQFDPSLVQALARCRDRINGLPDQDVWTKALQLAPDDDVMLRGADLDSLLGCRRRLRRSQVSLHRGTRASSGRAGRCRCDADGAPAHRRGRRTSSSAGARPRTDGCTQLGVGEVGAAVGVRPGEDPALPVPDGPDPQPGQGPGKGDRRRPGHTANASTARAIPAA